MICVVGLMAFTLTAHGNAVSCNLTVESLNKIELEILQAAKVKNYKQMAQQLACLLRMQTESEGLARLLAHGYLSPFLGGQLPRGIEEKPEYKLVKSALEDLALRSSEVTQKSFVAEFSRGEWSFYVLFCEQGNTQYCTDFLPDEKFVQHEPSLLAAASMLRLRKAYTVLNGSQKELVAKRLKELYKIIPKNEILKRKFIEEIHTELFAPPIPLSLLS